MSANIPTWQERVTENSLLTDYPDLMKAEIADLRAALAQRTEVSAPIQRYSEKPDFDGGSLLCPDDDGDYVKFADHVAAQASIEQRTAGGDAVAWMADNGRVITKDNYDDARGQLRRTYHIPLGVIAQPVAEAAAQVDGWDDAIEAAAEVVIKRTRVPRDLLGPAQPSHKALAATGEKIAEAIRALKPAAAPTAQPRTITWPVLRWRPRDADLAAQPTLPDGEQGAKP